MLARASTARKDPVEWLCLRYSFSVSRLVFLPSDLSLSEVDRYFIVRLRSSMATGALFYSVNTFTNVKISPIDEYYLSMGV